MEPPKCLIAYYSRTGTTEKVARELAEGLEADVEQIVDTKDREGLVGWFGAAKDAALRRATDIEPPQKNPAGYDLVLVGTPVWAFTVSCPVRSYLEQQRDRLPRVAFFLTTGGSGMESTFEKMAELSGKTPEATLGLRMKDVVKGRHTGAVDRFVEQLSE
ncbi:MAG: flavodoxin [Candidatus Brocadiia bacterium]